MMKNIMKKQNKGRTYYTAAPGPERWWTAIPAALALIAVLVIGWQFLFPNAEGPMTDDPTPTETAQMIERDIINLDELFPDVPEQYLDILGKYYEALAFDYGSEVWESCGLNLTAYENLDVIEDLGYTLMDLDGNGQEELLITDGDQVYDLYVEVDGEVRELLAGRIDAQGKRNSIKLCQDNTFMIWQRSSGVDYIHWWRLGKDGLGDIALVCEETVSGGDDGKWYAGPNDKDAVPVSEEEAREIMNSRDPVFVNYTSICPEKFAMNPDVMPVGFAQVIEKYIRAHEEGWSVEEYMQSDICYVLGMQDSIWQYGYALMDLNGDGIDELIITDGSLIYDLYILMEDGGAGHIISAGERARYYLCEGNIIGYRGSGGAANTVMEFFRVLPSDDFQYELKLEFDDGTWYTYKEYGKETPGGVDVVSEEQAQDLINGYGPAEIVYQSFLRPEQGKELIYPRTYKQLLQELMVKNSGVINMVVAYTDVTGDGIDDLLLGSRGADSFGHVYSVLYGGVTEILTYGSDIGFTLCKNGVICYHQADKPFGEYTFISLKNDEYQIIEHLTYDSNTGAWTRKTDGVTETITDAQKQEIVDSYGSLSLNWMGVLEAIGG
jgi:hypothetical protein